MFLFTVLSLEWLTLALGCINTLLISVIPAKTGIQNFQGLWTPAFAGVTIWTYRLIL